MECPSCGVMAAEGGRFCTACGSPLAAPGPAAGAAAQEQVLYRFGPMGIGISTRRPGLWVKQMENVTEVVVTEERLCGVSMFSRVNPRHRKDQGKVAFSIPWGDVISYERADFLMNRAIWIRYRVGEEVKEVSIIAGVMCHHHVHKTLELMQGLVKG